MGMINSLFEKGTHSNAAKMTLELLKKLKVPVSATTVIETIESHPDHPSLYSIGESLNLWKVENCSIKVETEKLDELPLPFIAHSRVRGGNFVLVKNVNGFIEYINENGKRKKISREEFNKEWDNVGAFYELL